MRETVNYKINYADIYYISLFTAISLCTAMQRYGDIVISLYKSIRRILRLVPTAMVMFSLPDHKINAFVLTMIGLNMIDLFVTAYSIVCFVSGDAIMPYII